MLIPFIDENRLISAMKDCEPLLSEQEKNRNRHGPMQVYVFCEEDLGKFNLLLPKRDVMTDSSIAQIYFQESLWHPPTSLLSLTITVDARR